MLETLKVYWNDCDDVVDSTGPRTLTQTEAMNRWADSSGAEGNFFGLIDADENTMQFYFEDSIPDDVEDAGHLEIVLLDFPKPDLRGSFQRIISIDESSEWIKRAFENGLDHEQYDGLTFCSWQ